jgi:hypothetical protein
MEGKEPASVGFIEADEEHLYPARGAEDPPIVVTVYPLRGTEERPMVVTDEDRRNAARLVSFGRRPPPGKFVRRGIQYDLRKQPAD